MCRKMYVRQPATTPRCRPLRAKLTLLMLSIVHRWSQRPRLVPWRQRRSNDRPDEWIPRTGWYRILGSRCPRVWESSLPGSLHTNRGPFVVDNFTRAERDGGRDGPPAGATAVTTSSSTAAFTRRLQVCGPDPGVPQQWSGRYCTMRLLRSHW